MLYALTFALYICINWYYGLRQKKIHVNIWIILFFPILAYIRSFPFRRWEQFAKCFIIYLLIEICIFYIWGMINVDCGCEKVVHARVTHITKWWNVLYASCYHYSLLLWIRLCLLVWMSTVIHISHFPML